MKNPTVTYYADPCDYPPETLELVMGAAEGSAKAVHELAAQGMSVEPVPGCAGDFEITQRHTVSISSV